MTWCLGTISPERKVITIKESLEKIQNYLENNLVQANTTEYLNNLRGVKSVRDDARQAALGRAAILHAAITEYLKTEYTQHGKA
jgi:hypothetical protein